MSGAIRAVVGPAGRHETDPTVVVGTDDRPAHPNEPTVASGHLVDGTPTAVRLVSLDSRHAIVLAETSGDAPAGRTRILFGETRRRPADGMLLREVVVDGWRVEVELESEARAALRERARRAGAATVAGGPAEVHAIIPGRIVAVSVGPGDPVVAGQQLLVLEAMKMQNELRAPREGTVERVAVAVGDTVEVGDLLLVIR